MQRKQSHKPLAFPTLSEDCQLQNPKRCLLTASLNFISKIQVNMRTAFAFNLLWIKTFWHKSNSCQLDCQCVAESQFSCAHSMQLNTSLFFKERLASAVTLPKSGHATKIKTENSKKLHTKNRVTSKYIQDSLALVGVSKFTVMVCIAGQ